jgi:hypothetical protein
MTDEVSPVSRECGLYICHNSCPAPVHGYFGHWYLFLGAFSKYLSSHSGKLSKKKQILGVLRKGCPHIFTSKSILAVAINYGNRGNNATSCLLRQPSIIPSNKLRSIPFRIYFPLGIFSQHILSPFPEPAIIYVSDKPSQRMLLRIFANSSPC